MKPALELTSVPAWATVATRPAADTSGTSWTIIAFGAAGADVARQWAAEIASRRGAAGTRVHEVPIEGGDRRADAALQKDLEGARVGWRLMLAGPAASCLRLRAAAMAAGIADDELTVASTDVVTRTVLCVHCGAVTVADVDLEDILACSGCHRNLVVYYHVSRRKGAHLGFMSDAEHQVVS
ncbi:dimethylamine monooxygenase subunit DmmA family protein [Mycobacterium sp. smrl_JER01]|uniref:dimethylamine monooxygenase subunit DmmA family protein n=1 Tax=Mycobacterium sp. smrl_JER01 TaxID=3402633 RepID=UPI003AD526E4